MPTWYSFPVSCHYNRCRCQEAAHTDPAPAFHLLPNSLKSAPSATGVSQGFTFYPGCGTWCSHSQSHFMLSRFENNVKMHSRNSRKRCQGYKRNIFLIVEKVCDSYRTVIDPCAQQHEEADPGLHFTTLQSTEKYNASTNGPLMTAVQYKCVIF